MAFIDNIVRLKDLLPDFIIKSFYFLKNPEINPTSDAYNDSLKNFVSSVLLLGGLITLIKAAIPNAFSFDAVAGINPFVLALILLANGIGFSLVFLFLAWCTLLPFGVLIPKAYYGYQALRLFAVQNVLLTILIMISINRISVTHDFTKAVSTLDSWIGLFFCALMIILMFRCLIAPFANHLSLFYKRKLAWTLSIIVVSISCYFNPTLDFSYYNNLIDSGKLCEAIIEEKFFDDIAKGKINYHQKLFECKALYKQ